MIVAESERGDRIDVPRMVHTCGRIGMQASPPRSSLTGWLCRGLAR